MTKNVFICGLMLGFFIVGCGQDQERPDYAETKDSVIEKGSSLMDEGKKSLQQAEHEALRIKESMEKQANEIASKGGKMIDQAKTKAESIKNDTEAAIVELITNAKSFLDQGKFNEAIASAKEVLTDYDSNFQKAKDIITTATEKLKVIATEKAKEALEATAALKSEESLSSVDAENAAEELETTAVQKSEDLKNNVTDKLNSLEQ